MKIAIVPAGQWGTALAIPLSDNHHTISLWMRTSSEAMQCNTTHQSSRFSPPLNLPASVSATDNLAEALNQVDLVIVACSSQGLRDITSAIKPLLPEGTPVLSIIKGLEKQTNLRPSEVIRECLPQSAEVCAVLSGPNFATEVATHKPTATVIASTNRGLAQALQKTFSTEHFKVYASDDVIGVELGGTLKNVVAMVTGISDGMQAGENARAALMTRGFAEVCKISEACGARLDTLYGLSGLGDLFLTSAGEQSRNHQYGKLLAQGSELTNTTVEGLNTLDSALELARIHSIDTPIISTLKHVIDKDWTIAQAGEFLMRG